MADREAQRAATREYLKEHKVDKLFQDLGSALVLEQPSDVHSFLLGKLKELHAKRGAQQQGSLFNDTDISTLFDMYDQKKAGAITAEHCRHALRVLGLDEGTCASAVDHDTYDRSAFIGLCNQALLSGDVAVAPETEEEGLDA